MTELDLQIKKEFEEMIVFEVKEKDLNWINLFCNSKTRCKQAQKDNRLLNTQQVSTIFSLHNEEFQYSQSISVDWRPDVQDRSGISTQTIFLWIFNSNLFWASHIGQGSQNMLQCPWELNMPL
ncbi:MAG: hypothetical protein EZS28_021425 [Streblomastix strix]|uniref:Uncharacterized protein n=1 Tax=Streblomastix strix TaxID=222440 RepID=A0A5J4VK75_9EUKA|nr:MAG: hypothetical protein EZS28_021425 [Streblomastix strix]